MFHEGHSVLAAVASTRFELLFEAALLLHSCLSPSVVTRYYAASFPVNAKAQHTSPALCKWSQELIQSSHESDFTNQTVVTQFLSVQTVVP